MPNRNEIRASIDRLDESKRLLEYPEVRELPHILQKDEDLKQITTGVYEDRKGILVATGKRLLFIHKGVFLGKRVDSFPYEEIISVKSKSGINLGDLMITTSNGISYVHLIDRSLLDGLVEYITCKLNSR
jgi:hypothetical protein